VLQRAGLFLGQDDYLSGSLCESLEQKSLYPLNSVELSKSRQVPFGYREAPMCPFNDTESAQPAPGRKYSLRAAFWPVQLRIAG
jgi:hypothetical protein